VGPGLTKPDLNPSAQSADYAPLIQFKAREKAGGGSSFLHALEGKKGEEEEKKKKKKKKPNQPKKEEEERKKLSYNELWCVRKGPHHPCALLLSPPAPAAQSLVSLFPSLPKPSLFLSLSKQVFSFSL